MGFIDAVVWIDDDSLIRRMAHTRPALAARQRRGRRPTTPTLTRLVELNDFGCKPPDLPSGVATN
jgi:hypothetical protein